MMEGEASPGRSSEFARSSGEVAGVSGSETAVKREPEEGVDGEGYADEIKGRIS